MIELLLHVLIFLPAIAFFAFIACDGTKSFHDIPRGKIVIKDDIIISKYPHLRELEDGGWMCPECMGHVTVWWDPPLETQWANANYSVKIHCENCDFSVYGVLFFSEGIIAYERKNRRQTKKGR